MTLHERFLEWWIEEHGQPPSMEWAICEDCRGEGTSTRHLGAYTQSDREEMGEEWWDFIDDVRRGVYDQPCDECGGSGKVRRFFGPAADAFHEWACDEAEMRHTQRMESGIWD